MFGPESVSRKLDLFESANGWRPIPHSVEEVDAWVHHLNNDSPEGVIKHDKAGNIDLRRPLTAKEKRWIANERAMCSCDCGYYLTRYYMISSESQDGKTGNVMHFAFRSGQNVFYKLLQKLDDQGVSKEVFCIKARKQGLSTLAEGIMSWGPQFLPGVKAAVSSADGQKTQIMMGMMTFAIDELPWWLEPTKTRDQRSSDRALLEWSHIGGMVMVQPGSMRGGIGQGTTPSFAHVSEASQFTDHVTQLDEGLFKAMTAAPGNVLIIETTGDGNQWVREMWQNCKDNYWDGRARFLPVFLPWFMTPELFPSVSWIKKYPIPEGWTPAPETVEMIIKAETYVRSTKILYEELGLGWRLPPEQQWYWEFNFQEHKRRGIERSWRRQMPVDDYEALLGDNDKAVGEEALANMLQTVDISPHIYMVAGEGIEPKHEPKANLILNGEDARRLYAEWTSPKGELYSWGFIPMLGDPANLDFNPLKHALIYSEPEPGYDYGIGVDTGTGVDKDRSVICVTRGGGLDEPDIQVAEFADSSIGNTELYAWIAAITALYSRYMSPTSIQRHPKLAIEMRRKYGDMSYHQLRLMGFHRHHDFVPLDKKTFRPVTGKLGRPGWWTNVWSRPMLLGFFTSSLENGWYGVRSRYLQREIEDAEIRILASGQSRMDHRTNHHDDRIFAAAMSHFTLHPAEVLADWSKRRYNRGQEPRFEISYDAASVLIENCSEGWLSGNTSFAGGRR